MSGYRRATGATTSHLWWTGAKPGDKLDLAVPVEKAGTYRLKMQLTKAVDYGIVQLSLDGKKLGEPDRPLQQRRRPHRRPRLGTHELTQGEHKLTVEIVGANDKAVKTYMFGLDYVKLEKHGNRSMETPRRRVRHCVLGGLPFSLPEDPDYTILDSAKDSVRFTVERTLVEYKGHLCQQVQLRGQRRQHHGLARLRQSRRPRLGGQRRRRGL